MNQDPFSILAHRASPSRLAMTEATAQAGPIAANARKTKRKKGDVNKRCQQQAEAWTAFVPTFCPEGAFCEVLAACATPLTSCDFTSFLACLGGDPGDPAE